MLNSERIGLGQCISFILNSSAFITIERGYFPILGSVMHKRSLEHSRIKLGTYIPDVARLERERESWDPPNVL